MLGYYNYTVWLTYGSLVSSMAGLLLGFCGYPAQAALCLLICAILDAFDGTVARTKSDRTEKEKRYGIQIDSFSDFMAFGILPCAVGYGLFIKNNQPVWMIVLYGIASCLLALAAMIRLANFNVEEECRQEETQDKRNTYTGMPVIITAGIMPLLVIAIKLLNLETVSFALFVVSMPVLGLLFLHKKVQIRKPNGKRLVVLLFCGIVEVLLLLNCL